MCARCAASERNAGITTTAAPTLSAAHSSVPTPSDVRISWSAIIGASSSATTSAVPPISTERPLVASATLAARAASWPTMSASTSERQRR